MSEENKSSIPSSVITERLKVAKTIDTTLTEEEEIAYEKAAKEAKEISNFHKKQWIGFCVMMFVMTALLIYLLCFYVEFV